MVAEALERFRIREAQQRMMHLARQGNKYLTEQEPWKTQKTDPARTATVLHWAAQTAAQLSQLMEPFLPFSARRLQKDHGGNSDGSLHLVSPDPQAENGAGIA